MKITDITEITKIKRLRFYRDLSMDEVYLRSGGRVHPPRMSRIERGILRASVRERTALAKVFGLPESELFMQDGFARADDHGS
jgi:transcriptional regulator with XRE-family HTH domain